MKELFGSITGSQITFWIAVAGFLMSLATWIKDIVTQRVIIGARITQIRVHPISTSAFFYVIITNKSRLSLTITDIAIIQSNGVGHCVAKPKLVLEHTRTRNGEIIDRQAEYSTAMPVHLPGLGGTNVLVLFDDLPQKIPSDATNLTLAIYTNRGRTKKMRLELPQGWAGQSTS